MPTSSSARRLQKQVKWLLISTKPWIHQPVRPQAAVKVPKDKLPVPIVLKDILSPIFSINNVIDHTRKFYSRFSDHFREFNSRSQTLWVDVSTSDETHLGNIHLRRDRCFGVQSDF
ncbi:MAG TPA: hypothetical protein VNY07_11495 [Chthoniobacterales bacterium]|jgi:hypothetical protein|nr:hypothetical protein [Chthoniobacterales bacterium]